jgi:hypothetical protein
LEFEGTKQAQVMSMTISCSAAAVELIPNNSTPNAHRFKAALLLTVTV